MRVRTWFKGLSLMLAAFTLAGCVTMRPIDWASRVGSYTYDQAVTELGPPDKSAKLSDGSLVADWLQRPAEAIVTPEPYFPSPGYYWAPFPPVYSAIREPALYLRLTFGADGKLEHFKRLAR